ncbi:MAG: helix-turn-helix domain-containing protein [Dehalococcoidia bacterium]
MTNEWHLGDRLREVRLARQLSVRTLASRAGFSPSFISQVELGQASPSIASLERIAAALDVTLSSFFPDDEQAPSAVVRAGARQELTSVWSQAQIEALGPVAAGRTLEPMLITLAPGGRSSKDPVPHAQEQFTFVLDGRLTLILGEMTHDLSAGDAVTLTAGTPHRWENTGVEPARLLIVTARPAR